MGYIGVKILPNHIPVTAGNPVHYSQLEFMIYKTNIVSGEKLQNFRAKKKEAKPEIKKGPRIVITAKTAPQKSIRSEEVLCISTDIPAAGYSFTAPLGWSCSHTYDSDKNQVIFIFTASVEDISHFTSAAIRLNSFFTTAQAGVTVLDVSVENFSIYLPDVEDCTFSIPLSKRYHLEILEFMSNKKRGIFYLNHNLPSLFEWDVVCDLDTPLELLVDGTFYSALQQFTGEKNMETREKGDHTYTLKMDLPEGEKTKTIKIKDTIWRKIEEANDILPDFSRQNNLLSWKDELLLFYGGSIYQTVLDQNYKIEKWKLLRSYSGKVQYPDTTAVTICEDKLYLIGGTKPDSEQLFYSVYNLQTDDGRWLDFDAGQFSMLTGGTAASDGSDSRFSWIVYGKQTQDSILFMEYIPKQKKFSGIYQIELEGLKFFTIEMQRDVLYLALSTEDGILLKTWKRGEKGFCKAGMIAASPSWMRWIRGNNNLYLLTEDGLYREGNWENIEGFRPDYFQDTFPWSGHSSGRIVNMLSKGDGMEGYEIWATDVL